MKIGKIFGFFPQNAIQQNDLLSVVGNSAIYNKRSIAPRLKNYDFDYFEAFYNSDR